MLEIPLLAAVLQFDNSDFFPPISRLSKGRNTTIKEELSYYSKKRLF
jgi:hypothetical protein